MITEATILVAFWLIVCWMISIPFVTIDTDAKWSAVSWCGWMCQWYLACNWRKYPEVSKVAKEPVGNCSLAMGSIRSLGCIGAFLGLSFPIFTIALGLDAVRTLYSMWTTRYIVDHLERRLILGRLEYLIQVRNLEELKKLAELASKRNDYLAHEQALRRKKIEQELLAPTTKEVMDFAVRSAEESLGEIQTQIHGLLDKDWGDLEDKHPIEFPKKQRSR